MQQKAYTKIPTRNIQISISLLLFGIFLALPAKAIALSCVEFPYTAVVECKNNQCTGFSNYIPACSWVAQVDDLGMRKQILISNYMVFRFGEDNFDGVWQITVDEECAWAHYQEGVYRGPIEDLCGPGHEELIEIEDLSTWGTSLNEAKAQADKSAGHNLAARNISTGFQVFLFIGLGSLVYIGLIIRYIINGGKGLLVLILVWVILQAISALLLGFAGLFWLRYSDGIEWIILAMGIFLLLGIGMLIGNWLNNRILFFKNSMH